MSPANLFERIFKVRRLKTKLLLMIIVPTVSVLVLSSGAIFSYESVRAKKSIVQDSFTLAQITASSSTAALAFNDQKSLNEYLASLGVRSDVVAACIYGADQKLAGKYVRQGTRQDCPQPREVMEDGYNFQHGLLLLYQPVRLEGQRIGTVFIASDLRQLHEALKFHAELIGTVLAIAVLIILLASGRLQRSVSNPILSLTRTARAVAENKDYSIRASGTSQDELGILVLAFNTMLEQIETQNANLEHLLQESQKAVQIRDEFMSIASHELKTPLTSLRAQVQMLERLAKTGALKTTPAAQIQRLMSFTDQQVIRLVTLIEDLLDVTRITTGRLHLNYEQVNVCSLVSEIVESHKAEILKSGSTVETHIEEPVVARCDHLRLEQVIVNLLINALKYGQGKPIKITVRRTNGSLRMVVEDHGIGISPAAQERIFDRFERAVSATHYGGLGLGLYITRQIILAHQGTIRVISVEGSGSTFIVELPL
jgi:signal transduction histidine kinase